MTGDEVKKLIFSNGLKCWQVAYAWGISDGNFSRKLRKPFNESDTQKLYEIISKLTAQQNGGAIT
ncbi:MAG: hypothetical protein HFJ89_10985 [Oscillospiraceae bacterium]|jgi:hypothetical protein|nr:hypothetical protein [Oscillospiraceae bacterium]